MKTKLTMIFLLLSAFACSKIDRVQNNEASAVENVENEDAVIKKETIYIGSGNNNGNSNALPEDDTLPDNTELTTQDPTIDPVDEPTQFCDLRYTYNSVGGFRVYDPDESSEPVISVDFNVLNKSLSVKVKGYGKVPFVEWQATASVAGQVCKKFKELVHGTTQASIDEEEKAQKELAGDNVFIIADALTTKAAYKYENESFVSIEKYAIGFGLNSEPEAKKTKDLVLFHTYLRDEIAPLAYIGGEDNLNNLIRLTESVLKASDHKLASPFEAVGNRWFNMNGELKIVVSGRVKMEDESSKYYRLFLEPWWVNEGRLISMGYELQ